MERPTIRKQTCARQSGQIEDGGEQDAVGGTAHHVIEDRRHLVRETWIQPGMGTHDSADDNIGPGFAFAARETLPRVDAGDLRLDLDLATEQIFSPTGHTGVCGKGHQGRRGG